MPKLPSFFSKVRPDEVTVDSLTAELNNAVSDLEIKDDQLSGGQNMVPASDTSLTKRDGTSLFGPLLGSLPITGGFNYVSSANGIQRQLVCYNTGVNIHTSTASTPISGITLTQGVQCDGTYFPFTDKFYITNGTDTVARVANDGTGDQTSTLPQGKYVTSFMNRILVANTSSHPDYVYYSDAEADTLTSSATQWFQVVGEITGIITYYAKVLIFTKRKIYRLENFTFDGTSSWASQLFELPVEFGAIIENTIKVVNGYVYFLGQDMNSVAAVYQCDGYTAQNISEKKILATVRSLSGSLLNGSCAVADGVLYRLYVPETGQGTNTAGIIYDTDRGYFYTLERKFILGIADYSCMWSSENQGVWTVYAGTSGPGQVMQLHSNAGLYDELPEESDMQSGNADLALDANPAKRVAQKFQVHNYSTTNSGVYVTQLAFQIKKNAGTTTGITLRIETDNNGLPSGTLANANATVAIPAITSASYSWIMAKFAIAPPLTGSTTYHAVLRHTTEGTGNSQYFVNSNSAGTYAYGNTETYQSTTSTVTNSYSPASTNANADVTHNNFSGDTFSGMRSAATGALGYDQLGPELVSQTTSNMYIKMARDILFFDTSSLPSSAVISSAKIRNYFTYATDSFSQSVNYTSITTSSNTTVSGTDYAISEYGSTRFSTDVPISSLSINAYNDFILNSSGIANINKGGISKFSLRLSCDIDNSAPTWVSNGTTNTQYNNITHTTPPLLVVTYSVSSGSFSWTAVAGSDTLFSVWVQSPIDGYADTKAYLPVEGKELKVTKFQSIFSQIGPYYVEVGFEVSNSKGTFRTFLVPISSSGLAGKWDDLVSKWDDGVTVWDGNATRNLGWTDIGGLVTRIVKVRIRNRNANQNFEFNKLILETYPRMRNA